MMWYEENNGDSQIAVASRIRLDRNFRDYRFPERMEKEERSSLTDDLMRRLSGTDFGDGRSFRSIRLDNISRPEREALAERMLIGKSCLEHSEGGGLYLSRDEAVSITVNSVSHIRLQISRSGMDFRSLWGAIDRLDDKVAGFYPYAFDEKFGYRTTYPTNVGTGMKAFLVLHLPLLDSVEKFPEIMDEMGRYGLRLTPAFGKNREQCGNLYVLMNRKTLGVSEHDIMDIMENVAGQLISQEKSMRENSVKHHRLHTEDLCYKAYGTLRYARLMPWKTAMTLLSKLRLGQEEGVIGFERYCCIYELMTGIQRYSLEERYHKSFESEEELDHARAEYLKEKLPRLKDDGGDSEET